MYDHLQTMQLRCTAVFLHDSAKFTRDEIARIACGPVMDERIGVATLHQLYGKDRCPDDSGPLEYLSTTNTCELESAEIPIGLQHLAMGTSESPKHMFSLKPTRAFMLADELKKEMTARYAGDGYFFLEEHIDSMMEPSQKRLVRYLS